MVKIKTSKTKRIVVITDCVDVAYSEVRAMLIRNLGPKAKDIVIEPVAPVIPFSIINGSFILRLLAEVYPTDTFFLIILHPSKHRAERIMGETKNGFKFIGANTGVFGWLIHDFGLKKLYEVEDPGFFPFGGKYVHAPVAARIALGEDMGKLGYKRHNDFLKKLEIKDGTIVHIDNFGLITIKGKSISYKEGKKINVFVNGKKRLVATYANRMMSRNDNEWVIYSGSSLGGMPELGKVRCVNGVEEIGVKIGDIVTWSTS